MLYQVGKYEGPRVGDISKLLGRTNLVLGQGYFGHVPNLRPYPTHTPESVEACPKYLEYGNCASQKDGISGVGRERGCTSHREYTFCEGSICKGLDCN